MGMTVTDLIPKGSKNAISRTYLLTLCKEYGLADTDRKMRKLIEDARKESVIICLCNGDGYFMPDENDHDKLRHYIHQEKDRYTAIIRNLRVANAMLEDMEKGRLAI